MRKTIYFLSIIFLLLIPISYSSTGFTEYVNNGKNSITLQHKEIARMPIKIISNNDGFSYACDLDCYFTVNGKDKKYFSSLGNGGTEDTKEFSITAPIKGKEGDSNPYIVEIICIKSTYGLCTNEDPIKKEELITVTYELTQEEKEARNYVQQNLPMVSSDLTNTDISIKKIENKLSQLSNNIKIGSISSETSNLRSNYNLYKSEADKIKALFEDFDYILAKSNLRSSLNQDIDNINLQAIDIEKKLDEVIKQHNEAASKLGSLSKKMNSISTLLNILNKEETNTIFGIKEIINNFEKGNFVDYSSLNSQIINLEKLSNEEELNLRKETEEIGKDGILIYTIEVDSLCKEGLCLEKANLDKTDIKNICSNLNLIKNKISEENSLRKRNFNEFKDKYEQTNKEVLSLNSILKEINTNIKKDTKTDLIPCRKKIEEINSNIINFRINDLEPLFKDSEEKCKDLLNNIKNEIVDKDGFFKRFVYFFKNILKFKSKIDLIKGLEESKEQKTITISEESNQFLNLRCNLKNLEQESMTVSDIRIEEREIKGESIGELEERKEQCCVLGECTPCCIGDECTSDPSTYPIIFVHGHSAFSWNNLDYSINAFRIFQDKLSEEKKYLSAGIILPETDINKVKAGDWGKIRKPVSILVSYYKGVYNEQGGTIGKQQDQQIDIYSQRLSDIVDKVLHHTNKDKVIIVAHSMGGLVSRNYIKNYGGQNKVYKLVTIGTPNHGIFGWLVGGLCGATHLGLPECQDMQPDSNFMKNLNSGNEAIVSTLAIIGTCREEYDPGRNITYKHDEVVRDYSAKINGAQNIVINGNCIDGGGTFHQELVKNNEVYKEIINFLNI